MRPARSGRGHVRRIERNGQLAPGSYILLVRLDQLRLRLHGEHAELQRLIGGSLTGGDPFGLHAIDAVGKLGQGVVHLDALPRHQHAEIVRPHLGGQIVTGPVQRQFRVVEIDFRRGLGEPQLAAGDDRLTDAAALVAGGQPRIDVIGLIADVRVGIGAGLDHVAAGGFHVGRRLANERIAGHRHRLQLGERQRRLAGRGDRLGRGGDDVQVGKEGFDRAALFGRRGPRLDRRQTQRRRRAARDRAGDFQRLNGPRRPSRCRGFVGRGPAVARLLARVVRPVPQGILVRRAKQDLPAVPAAAHGWDRELSRRRFLAPEAKAAGSCPWGSRPGIRHGCRPGTACHTDNRPCTRTAARQERHAVRWSSPSWQASQSRRID